MACLLFCIRWTMNAGQDVPKPAQETCSASVSDPAHPPDGARDGDRFSNGEGQCWSATLDGGKAWWQIRFDPPRAIGAIAQIHGSHPFVFTNAPVNYVWQGSTNGADWVELDGSRVPEESRLFRIHRLSRASLWTHVRLVVHKSQGVASVLREVEFYPTPSSPIPFPDWSLVVNVTHDSSLPGHGQEFIPLGQSVDPSLQAQQIWLPRLNPAFLAIEPKPLCVFLSGSFKDWCEVDRNSWRGAEQVLLAGSMPLWASCGGAQALAILSETGTSRPWDCPHCRDPRAPKLPIYGHIGHGGPGIPLALCGDYSGCVFERGPHTILSLGTDPVFAGLPAAFDVMESHCGQVEWIPAGWELLAEGGPGTRTRIQCLRRRGYPIYAAQFHIEMQGTPASSRAIMKNFLEISRAWRDAGSIPALTGSYRR